MPVNPDSMLSFVRTNYPGYLEFLAEHFPVKNATVSETEHAEFLIRVIPELKTIYTVAGYAPVIKKHLPEQIDSIRLAAFAQQFYDLHFQRSRDRANERQVRLYKLTALAVIVEFFLFCGLGGFLSIILTNIAGLVFVAVMAYATMKALLKLKYEPLRMIDHFVFAANIMFNTIFLFFLAGYFR